MSGHRDLPTGTVTFLFTDVEGSTAMLGELGTDGYAEALDEHRRLLRAAFERYEGVEVDTQGDAFLVAFARATDALAAAVEGQEHLEESGLRGRMGLHTGEPLRTSEGYVGLVVHKAARIAAAGHGGQILLPGDVRPHRGRRERARAAPAQRPRRAGAPLPARRQAVPAAEIALFHEPPGAGDTVHRSRARARGGRRPSSSRRCALRDADRSRRHRKDASCTAGRSRGLGPLPGRCDLDTTRVAPRPVFRAERNGAGGRRKRGNGDRSRRAAPGCSREATDAPSPRQRRASAPRPGGSRRSRRVGVRGGRARHQPGATATPGEHLYSVPTLGGEDGVELFLARARAVDHRFEGNGALAELCERLENLPLALELAAPRTNLFTPNQLLERFAERLDR